MCLSPFPNTQINSVAYKNGIYTFACGHCPECLQSRVHKIIPPSYYEALMHKHNCMITLTYDNYERDARGKLTGRELPPNRDLHVCRRDITLFIKRLRKYLSTYYSNLKIKYRGAAEYGSTTHRAHYHLIIYGFDFPDRVPYKRSKRGSQIFISPLLQRLWNHGICTVDCVSINSNVIAYCSKYLSKDRSEDTFSLSSQKLGHDLLLQHFNGISYHIQGREYPIPRTIWNSIIESRYRDVCPRATSKYVNFSESSYLDGSYKKNQLDRRLFHVLKRSDPQYLEYLAYWKQQNDLWETTRLPVRERILALPNKKTLYKNNLLAWHDKCVQNRLETIPINPPLCDHKSERPFACYCRSMGIKYRDPADRCRIPPCLNTATDTGTVYTRNKLSQTFFKKAGITLPLASDYNKIPIKDDNLVESDRLLRLNLEPDPFNNPEKNTKIFAMHKKNPEKIQQNLYFTQMTMLYSD